MLLQLWRWWIWCFCDLVHIKFCSGQRFSRVLNFLNGKIHNNEVKTIWNDELRILPRDVRVVSDVTRSVLEKIRKQHEGNPDGWIVGPTDAFAAGIWETQLGRYDPQMSPVKKKGIEEVLKRAVNAPTLEHAESILETEAYSMYMKKCTRAFFADKFHVSFVHYSCSKPYYFRTHGISINHKLRIIIKPMFDVWRRRLYAVNHFHWSPGDQFTARFPELGLKCPNRGQLFCLGNRDAARQPTSVTTYAIISF